MPSSETLARMKKVVGAKGFIDDANDMAPYLAERRELYRDARRRCCGRRRRRRFRR